MNPTGFSQPAPSLNPPYKPVQFAGPQNAGENASLNSAEDSFDWQAFEARSKRNQPSLAARFYNQVCELAARLLYRI